MLGLRLVYHTSNAITTPNTVTQTFLLGCRSTSAWSNIHHLPSSSPYSRRTSAMIVVLNHYQLGHKPWAVSYVLRTNAYGVLEHDIVLYHSHLIQQILRAYALSDHCNSLSVTSRLLLRNNLLGSLLTIVGLNDALGLSNPLFHNFQAIRTAQGSLSWKKCAVTQRLANY